MLAKVKIYKGIEYVELDDLPIEQSNSFKEWAPREAFIKIMIKDKVVSNCVQYKHYKDWYKTFYKVEQPLIAKLPIKDEVVLNKP